MNGNTNWRTNSKNLKKTSGKNGLPSSEACYTRTTIFITEKNGNGKFEHVFEGVLAVAGEALAKNLAQRVSHYFFSKEKE